jgi:hypothetical protein
MQKNAIRDKTQVAFNFAIIHIASFIGAIVCACKVSMSLLKHAPYHLFLPPQFSLLPTPSPPPNPPTPATDIVSKRLSYLSSLQIPGSYTCDGNFVIHNYL